ncbi:CDP-glycerol glycerophosphotransferase family protein, partial [Photobacterium sanctipauli]
MLLLFVVCFELFFLSGWIYSPILILSVTALELLSTVMFSKDFDKIKNSLLTEKVNAQKLKPKVIFYFCGPKGAEYQLKMWLPYVEKLELPFIVVLRDYHHYEAVKSFTNAPVLLCNYVSEVDDIVFESVELVLYANNSAKNTQMVRFNDLIHIQLLHGDSDKSPSYSPVSKLYDKLFVSGKAAIDRYSQHNVKIPNDSFELIGRPQLDSLSKDNIDSKKRKTIVYAPTWRGDFSDSNYSSLYNGDQIVKSIISAGYNVIVKLHPYTNRDVELVKVAAKIKNIVDSVSDK